MKSLGNVVICGFHLPDFNSLPGIRHADPESVSRIPVLFCGNIKFLDVKTACLDWASITLPESVGKAARPFSWPKTRVPPRNQTKESRPFSCWGPLYSKREHFKPPTTMNLLKAALPFSVMTLSRHYWLVLVITKQCLRGKG
jgi:hypothetical protein